MACKEYSAVFQSLWISEDKTALRGRCPTQCMADAESEGKGWKAEPAAGHFDDHFSRSFGEGCALPASCGSAKGLGWPC